MRGRRPKPTRLKVLTGNPGKRALNEAEPRPEPEIPDCPPELGPIARREWERLVAELAPLRILTQLDRAALATYCGAYGLWADATEAINKIRRHDQITARLPDPVALPRHRQPTSRDHAPHRFRIRLHARKQEQDFCADRRGSRPPRFA